MRKFKIGENVKIEKDGMIEGKIIDKKYIWPLTEYAVESVYADCRWERDIKIKTHIDWLYPGDICKTI